MEAAAIGTTRAREHSSSMSATTEPSGTSEQLPETAKERLAVEKASRAAPRTGPPRSHNT